MNESCNKQENSKYVINLVILYFIIYIGKKIINFILKKGSDYLSNKNNIKPVAKKENSLEDQIANLKKEAEMYNNPQSYVKYAKIEREIAKLMKQSENLKENSTNVPKEENLTDALNLKIPYSTYINFLVEGLFFLLHILCLYYFKGTYFIIDNKHADGNVVFDYFKNNDEGCIMIPINVVFFLEGLFIHKIMSLINKLIKQ